MRYRLPGELGHAGPRYEGNLNRGTWCRCCSFHVVRLENREPVSKSREDPCRAVMCRERLDQSDAAAKQYKHTVRLGSKDDVYVPFFFFFLVRRSAELEGPCVNK